MILSEHPVNKVSHRTYSTRSIQINWDMTLFTAYKIHQWVKAMPEPGRGWINTVDRNIEFLPLPSVMEAIKDPTGDTKLWFI